MKDTKKGIPINIDCCCSLMHSGYITQILAGSGGWLGRLVAIFELDPSAHGLISSRVVIPAEPLSKEELVKIVAKGAKEILEQHIKEGEQYQRERQRFDEMKKIAENINKTLGLA